VIFLDSRRNRRNESGNRAAFEAQGDYFRCYDDAGFVADPADLLSAHRRIEESGREIVAIFHSHRRQPPDFSWIDFRLHNPAFRWHLIISFHSGPYPRLQPFRVDKDGIELDVSEHDNREGSELATRSRGRTAQPPHRWDTSRRGCLRRGSGPHGGRCGHADVAINNDRSPSSWA
jgi:proteasome lid subunit RPN8/RPN11